MWVYPLWSVYNIRIAVTKAERGYGNEQIRMDKENNYDGCY